MNFIVTEQEISQLPQRVILLCDTAAALQKQSNYDKKKVPVIQVQGVHLFVWEDIAGS